jgi:IPT/TIG domain
MTYIRCSRKSLSGALGGVALCFALSLSAAAQVQTQKTETHGPATKEVKVERGEIVYINGNNLVIKMEDGSFRHFDNVPDSVSVMVDGKPVNIHNVKVGMKVEKQTITTTTPKVITTVQTVTGTVWHVAPPNTVILTMENGENQSFKIPKGQKFTVDGRETDAFGLKKGMKVQAQKVVEVPEVVMAQEIKRTGKMPPPPPEPKADLPMLVASAPPTPAPAETAAAEPAPKKLPKTASNFPLIGLLGALLCASSVTGMAIRKVGIRMARS